MNKREKANTVNKHTVQARILLLFEFLILILCPVYLAFTKLKHAEKHFKMQLNYIRESFKVNFYVHISTFSFHALFRFYYKILCDNGDPKGEFGCPLCQPLLLFLLFKYFLNFVYTYTVSLRYVYNIYNKNYYVVGDAGFTRPRNPLKLSPNFF